MQVFADSSRLPAALQQPFPCGVPAPHHHRLSLSPGHGAQSVPLLANSPWAQQSCCPALGPLAPRPLVHGCAGSPASLVGSLFYPGPLDSRWRQPVPRAGVKSKLLLPTQTRRGASRPNEQTAHITQQCQPHNAILLCCVGMQRASSPGVGHCLQCLVGVCVSYTGKSRTSALHIRGKAPAIPSLLHSRGRNTLR